MQTIANPVFSLHFVDSKPPIDEPIVVVIYGAGGVNLYQCLVSEEGDLTYSDGSPIGWDASNISYWASLPDELREQ